MLKIILFGFGLSLLGVTMTLSATELYRWVDQDGNVQFTQTPPPENAQDVTTRPLGEARPAAKTPQATQGEGVGNFDEANDFDRVDDLDDESLSEEAKEMRKHKAENCQAARDNLARLNAQEPLMEADPDNPSLYRIMPDETRQKETQRAQAYLDNFCLEPNAQQ